MIIFAYVFMIHAEYFGLLIFKKISRIEDLSEKYGM
jgi:hypothetical protein